MERSEDQILNNDGLNFIFGGRKFPFKALNIRKTRAWLRSFYTKDSDRLTESQAVFAGEDPEAIRKFASNCGFDMMVDLVAEYADGVVTKEQIEELASPRELEAAYDQCLELSGFFDVSRGQTRRMKE